MPDGIIEAKSELSFEGVNDDAYRNAFSHMKPDDERRFFEQRLKQAMPGLRLKSLKLIPEDMRDVATGLRAELEFSVDGMTANGGGKSVVSMPWIGKRLGVSNFILDGTGLEKRKYPLRPKWPAACRRTFRSSSRAASAARFRCRRLRRWRTIA